MHLNPKVNLYGDLDKTFCNKFNKILHNIREAEKIITSAKKNITIFTNNHIHLII